MTIRDYARKHAKMVKDHGPASAVASATNGAFAKVALRPYVRHRQHQARRRLPLQAHLLNELRERDEWTLLVFDAGRYDYMAPLLSDAFAGEVQPTFSAARDTFEWSSKTWRGDFEDVTYITGMVPVADEIVDFNVTDLKHLYDGINPGDSIGEIVKAWETHWDADVATVPPESLTDVALDYTDRDKLVVHYAQPHSPYIGTPKLLGHTTGQNAHPKQGRPNDEPIWQRVRAGEVSDEYLRMAYWGNAARAISASEPLIRERETVVATSDHGEALGEWGMYTHDRAPHPKRRVVPWQRIECVADEQHLAKYDRGLKGKLEALGYI